MFDHTLFLGLPLTDTFLRKLNQLPLPLVETFIKDQSSDYLQKIESEGVVYLGKCIASPFDMAGLESLETNITSLLKRLVVDFPYEEHPLLLLALSSPQSQ